jgi:hypothetical protein
VLLVLVVETIGLLEVVVDPDLVVEMVEVLADLLLVQGMVLLKHLQIMDLMQYKTLVLVVAVEMMVVLISVVLVVLVSSSSHTHHKSQKPL